MKKVNKAAVLMLLCVAGMMVLYLTGNREAAFSYICTVVTGICSGSLFVSAIDAWEKEKRKKCFWLCMCVFFFAVLSGGRIGLDDLMYFQWEMLLLCVKYALVIFWPLIEKWIMKISQDISDAKKCMQTVLKTSICYCGLSLLGMWILENTMVFTESYREADRMVTEVLFLVICSIFVYVREYGKTLEKISEKVMATGIGIVSIISVGSYMTINSRRIREILYSMGVDLFELSESFQDVEWFSYRMGAAQMVWNGDLEIEMNNTGYLIWEKNPLICLRTYYGIWAVLLAFLLFAGVIYFSSRIIYKDILVEQIAGYIRMELMVTAVLSTMNELFLVQAGVGTGNYFPLLGYGIQFMPLLAVLYRGRSLSGS